MEYDGKSSEEDMLGYGLNADWDEFFDIDYEHPVNFYAYKIVNNAVMCYTTVTHMLETWD